MFQVSNKSTQKSYELGAKFNVKIPVQYQIWCVHCYLLFFSVSQSMFLLLTLNLLCFVVIEFKERRLILEYVLFNIVKNITGHFNKVSENYLWGSSFLVKL